MMELIQEGSPPPIPPPDGAERFVQGVEFKTVLAEKRHSGARLVNRMPWNGALFPPRPSASLIAVAVCLLLFIGGVIGVRQFTSFDAHSPLGNPPETTAVINDEEAEVIRNLELLQEMEAVRKLVQRVDHPEDVPSSLESTSDSGRSEAIHEVYV
jgi:hypothetical protein